MITAKGEMFKSQPELVFSHADYDEIEFEYPYREIGGYSTYGGTFWERYHEIQSNLASINDSLKKSEVD